MDETHSRQHRAAVAVAVVAVCATPGAFAAPAVLADAQLEAVTAGVLQAPPQAHGEQGAVIVADGSVLVLERDQRMALREDAQQGLQALNVVGAVGSDVGNAANLLS